MSAVPQLVRRLLYGTGMRLAECLNLRVKDLDFERHELTIRDGKGAKDRVSVLPTSCREDLIGQLSRVRALHEEDLSRGLGRAPLPYALAQKYLHADREWGWQYIFPASSHYTDRVSGVRHRQHIHETVVQRSFGLRARGRPGEARDAAHPAPFLCDPPARDRLRHPNGPGLLGHSDVQTTMIYTHVLNRGETTDG